MMKKINFLFILLILSACSPQVTEETDCCLPVNTVLPPTETPIPTPTLHPDFVALQNLISDSSNLVLLPDGTIENNGVPIPNLHVDQNGVINLIINNEHIVIETSQISFDDESGLTIDGYELNENGEWVEAVSGVMTNNGLEVTLTGDTLQDASQVIDTFLPPDAIANNEVVIDKFVAQFETLTIYFGEDEAKWVITPEGNVEYRYLNGSGTIAVYEKVSKLDTYADSDYEVVIDWNEMTYERLATNSVVWKLDSRGKSIDPDGTRSFARTLLNQTRGALMKLEYWDMYSGYTTTGIISPYKNAMVIIGYANLYRTIDETKRAVVTITDETGQGVIVLIVKNFPDKY